MLVTIFTKLYKLKKKRKMDKSDKIAVAGLPEIVCDFLIEGLRKLLLQCLEVKY